MSRGRGTLTGWLRGWRVSLRVARREARRAKGRSLLVVAMITVPVAALAFAAVNHDTFTLTPAERADRLMGTAQAAIIWPYDSPVHQDPADLTLFGPADTVVEHAVPPTAARLLPLLPRGTRATEDRALTLTVRTVAGTATLGARALDYADPLASGILRPLSGRAPAGAGEVALTPAASRRVGAGVGDSLNLADGSKTLRVVGTIEDPTDLTAATIVLGAATLPREALNGGPQGVTWLVATPDPLTWGQIHVLNTRGIVAISRHVLEHPPTEAERYPEFVGDSRFSGGVTGVVGGLALLEIVLLAGASFAVGARRRRRDLALVAAAGGTPAHVRWIVLGDGVVLGMLAAAAGVVIGVAAAGAGRPLLEEHLYHARSGGFRVFPMALGVLAALALAAGVLAALVPAWIASRQDVTVALTGRRGITRSRRRWVVLGVALGGAGGVAAAAGAWRVHSTVILVGLAMVELGLIVCTPAVVGLVARLGRFLPLAPRIALRDSSRNRTAAAPAISAVMAAVVGSLAVGVVLTATNQRALDEYASVDRPGDVVLDRSDKLSNRPEPVPAQAIAALRATMPVEQVHKIGLPVCGGGDCGVLADVPAANACPYASDVLRRDPTPGEQRAARRDSRCDGLGGIYRYYTSIYTDTFTIIIDPTAAGAAGLVPAEDADRVATALRAGKVVVDHPRYLDHDQVSLTIIAWHQGGKDGDRRTARAAGFALPHRPRAPILMMTPATARSLGLRSVASIVLATTSRMPTVAEQDRLQAALGHEAGVYVERGPQPRSDTAALVLLAVVAGLITLGAAAIATGLAAADSRASLGTLAVVGASPGVRRRLSLSQSGVIAGLGSLLGAVAGLGASVAVLVALNQGLADVWPAPTPYPISVPWLNVGVAVVVVPLVAMLGAGLLSRSRLPIERRR